MSQGTPSTPVTFSFTPSVPGTTGSLFNPVSSSTPIGSSALGQSASTAKPKSPTKTTTPATPATTGAAIPVAPGVAPPPPVLGTSAAAAASSAAPTPGPSAAGVSASINVPPTPTLNFRQLDTAVSKLIHTVNDHEKEFIALATRTNFYDQMIMENAHKITFLTQASEKIKNEQQKVENLMEATSDSQNELEALIVALEEGLPKGPTASSSEPQNRTKLYDGIAKFDDELRQMSIDLAEIITHANIKNRSDSNDPISHIIKVMNQHTDTLQWIDQSTESIGKELANLGIAQQDCRKSQERVMQYMYRLDKK